MALKFNSAVGSTLEYIERELRLMSRDPLGGMTYATYVDRLIDDICGVENMCTTVIAAKRPDAVILNVLKSDRGDSVMRLFDPSFHDTRMELRSLIIDAIKLSQKAGDGDSAGYLKRLYANSVRKTKKMVGGKPSTRESLEKRYPNLTALTGMTAFEDNTFSAFTPPFDEDDYESPFQSLDVSAYADDALDALREGRPMPAPIQTPTPEIKHNTPVNEVMEILQNVERSAGRALTTSEMIDLIHKIEEHQAAEEDEEPDQTQVSTRTEDDSETMDIAELDEHITNVVVNALKAFGLTPQNAAKAPEKDATPVPEKPTIAISPETNTEDLIKLRNGTTVKEEIAPSSDILAPASETFVGAGAPPILTEAMLETVHKYINQGIRTYLDNCVEKYIRSANEVFLRPSTKPGVLLEMHILLVLADFVGYFAVTKQEYLNEDGRKIAAPAVDYLASDLGIPWDSIEVRLTVVFDHNYDGTGTPTSPSAGLEHIITERIIERDIDAANIALDEFRHTGLTPPVFWYNSVRSFEFMVLMDPTYDLRNPENDRRWSILDTDLDLDHQITMGIKGADISNYAKRIQDTIAEDFIKESSTPRMWVRMAMNTEVKTVADLLGLRAMLGEPKYFQAIDTEANKLTLEVVIPIRVIGDNINPDTLKNFKMTVERLYSTTWSITEHLWLISPAIDVNTMVQLSQVSETEETQIAENGG